MTLSGVIAGVIGVLLVLALSTPVDAVVLAADGPIINITGANITPSRNLTFDSITIGSDRVVFTNTTTSGWNSTFFPTGTAGKLDIRVWNYSTDNRRGHSAMVNFTVNNSAAGTASFNVSDINTSRIHHVDRNGTNILLQAAGGSSINWTNSDWSWRLFELIGNSPPSIDAVADLVVNISDPVGIVLVATDPDGDVLTYSRNHTDIWLIWNATTGVANWTTQVSKLPFTTLWTVTDNMSASDNTTNTLSWFYARVKATAGDKLTKLNETAWNETQAAIQDADFMRILDASTIPYTNIMGNIFFLMLYSLAFLAIWMRQQNVLIPSILGLIVGSILILWLPADYQIAAVGFLSIGIAGVMYSIYVERR